MRKRVLLAKAPAQQTSSLGPKAREQNNKKRCCSIFINKFYFFLQNLALQLEVQLPVCLAFSHSKSMALLTIIVPFTKLISQIIRLGALPKLMLVVNISVPKVIGATATVRSNLKWLQPPFLQLPRLQ